MNRLTIAVVGCGLIAQRRHIPSFLKLDSKVSVSAVCDLNLNLAKDVARQFGIRRAYANISDMLSKEDPDIVEVCTPPQTHAEVAIQAMEAGCHVLIEKPMALTVDDCEEMIKASQTHGVKLSVVHNQRFSPPFLKARELVRNGTIGEVIGMRILALTRSDEFLSREKHWVHKLPGGVISESGPHLVYLSLPFVKDVRRVHVSATKTLDYPWVLFDTYSVGLVGDSVVSSMILSHAGNCVGWEIDLIGTQGMIRMDLHSMLLNVQMRRDLKRTSLALSSLGTSCRIATGVVSNAVSNIMGKTFLGHDLLSRRFVESVANGTPVPVPPEEGRDTTRVMEQISSMCVPA